LTNVALAASVIDQRFARPAQDVDEPWGDCEAGGVELAIAADRLANRGDSIADDADVTTERAAATAVVDRPATDD
jgi:hypothetical protein